MRKFIPLLILLALVVLFSDRLLTPRSSGSIDSPLIGKPLPDLGIKNLPVGPFVLNFFASWCGPCMMEHPSLMQMKNDGINIIGVAYEDKPEAIKNLLETKGNPYLDVVFNDDAAITMGITGVPENFAVDSHHIVRARLQGPLLDPGAIQSFLKAMQP